MDVSKMRRDGEMDEKIRSTAWYPIAYAYCPLTPAYCELVVVFDFNDRWKRYFHDLTV